MSVQWPNWVDPVFDSFVNARAQAIQLQPPAVVVQNAFQSNERLTAESVHNIFAPLCTTVYTRQRAHNLWKSISACREIILVSCWISSMHCIQ